MKNREFRRTPSKRALAAFLAVMTFMPAMSGCRGKEPAAGDIHVYSNGTSAVVWEQNVSVSENGADFYVPEGMSTDHYKTTALNDEERELYDKVLRDLGGMKERVTLEVDSDILQKVLEIIRFEQLAYFHVADRYIDFNKQTQLFEVVYKYRFTADEISSMNIASERAAREIMDMITPDMDDYDKIKLFHDYLVLNCENDTESPYSDTIYGALVQKKALCEGYSKAFSYLCNLAGIENTIVTGITTVPHMWNMVKLGGNWYHVDVTWDNPDDALHEEYPDVILYQYFMVTDSVIENNRIIAQYAAEPPKANGRNENYFVREGTDISSEEEFFTVSENAVLNAVRNHERSAMVKFASSDMYISVTSRLMKEPSAFETLRLRAQSECGVRIKLNWTNYYEQYRILTYIIEYE
ncbi:MAG: hypothetical protein NC253_07990 [Ruminococcus sp.]|nr:hypothetical protein [Ruminococcus sp.]MCM1478171.1 hypothetical protein [Muribaculaceae bacterium]